MCAFMPVIANWSASRRSARRANSGAHAFEIHACADGRLVGLEVELGEQDVEALDERVVLEVRQLVAHRLGDAQVHAVEAGDAVGQRRVVAARLGAAAVGREEAVEVALDRGQPVDHLVDRAVGGDEADALGERLAWIVARWTWGDANGAAGTPHSVAGPPPAAGFRASVVRD